MCGMCLPHCPTYLKTRNEADSPRGRIALIRSLNEGRLGPGSTLRIHLDRCLGCRACESVCPSAVPYGRLIDGARQLLRAPVPGPEPRPWWGGFVERRGLRRLLAGVLRFARLGGLERLAGLVAPAGTKRALALLGAARPGFFRRTAHAADGPRVALFTGCAAEVFDVQTLEAAERLLTRLGCRVDVPSAQSCCGALYQHDGLPGRARQLAQTNIAAFDIAECEAVLATASGCGAQLAEYAGMYPELFEASATGRFPDKVRDISRYLHESGLLDKARFHPLAKRVAVHTPCSLKHVLKAEIHPFALLERIPEISLLPLPDDTRCCGAAGKYLLSQPDMADALAQDKLDALKHLRPDILVTSNIGCALHLRAGIRREGLDIEVLHPVTLLERCMRQA